MVEPASTFLMSSFAHPIQAPISSVMVPTIATPSRASALYSKMNCERTIR